MNEVNQVSLSRNDLKVSDTLKKMAYCQAKLFLYEDAVSSLKSAKAVLDYHHAPNDSIIEELTELIASLHFELFKFPSFFEYISKTVTAKGYRDPWNTDLLCKCAYDIDKGDIDLKICLPQNPMTQTKMSGHKISFA